MDPRNMNYLVRSELCTRVTADTLDTALTAGHTLVYINKAGLAVCTDDPKLYPRDKWMKAVEKGKLFLLGGVRWYCTEDLTDDGLPIIPVPLDQVFKAEPVAIPAPVATQTELPLNEQPAQAAP